MTSKQLWLIGWTAVLLVGATPVSPTAQPADPQVLLKEADRLAWLRAWGAAERLYAEAEKLFAAQGDQASALYSEVSVLRGQLPRLPVPHVSARLAEYLEDPIVQADDRLRLRCLVIKGETDEDLDPTLAAQSWREAQALAEKIGDAAWANRAKGELGLVAFLQGDVGASVIGLGQALKVAQSSGDVSSQVRWLTLFGLGYVELGRPQEALDFYDRALKVASTVPELQFPVMTYVGRSDALIRMGRVEEADQILDQAGKVAERLEARGYQAQLLMQRALIADKQQQPDRALSLLSEAMELAHAAGGNRIVAEVALNAARIQRERNELATAEQTLRDGIQVARSMEERLLLPKLLAQLADLRSSQGKLDEAVGLLEEASEILEGFFTTTSSPWVQSRLISGMDDVFVARIRLEATSKDVGRMFSVVEEARGRSLLELLVNRPLSSQQKPQELRAGERQIAALQRQLLMTNDRSARLRLLDQIFTAEEQLAPISTTLFDRTRRTGPRKIVPLRDLQRALAQNEVFLEYALLEPASYAIVATRTATRLQRLPGRSALRGEVETLLKKVRAGENVDTDAAHLADSLIGSIPELKTHRRVVVSPDGELHQVPFELLTSADHRRLLESNVVSYAPSGSVFQILRSRGISAPNARRALAVSAAAVATSGTVPGAKATTRNVFDLDPMQLRPLPSADDEARSIGTIFGDKNTTVLLGDAATESEVKRQPLQEFQVLHFAAHGLPSTKFPARAALLLRPGGTDDGVLEAREILMLRLGAELVTLSSCDTGSGSVHGQEGAASLVRPFIAAGARSVVASLWAVDDTFSLAMMREFYRRLAAGSDVAEALRDAKLHMLTSFGPQAAPKLWSGVLVYGDASGVVTKTQKIGSLKR